MSNQSYMIIYRTDSYFSKPYEVRACEFSRQEVGFGQPHKVGAYIDAFDTSKEADEAIRKLWQKDEPAIESIDCALEKLRKLMKDIASMLDKKQ